MISLSSIPRKAAAGFIKFVMVVLMLTAIIAIPYFVISETWSFLVSLYHDHIVWFVIVLFPVVYLAIQIWKWLYELLGAFMMEIGKVVDKLEK